MVQSMERCNLSIVLSARASSRLILRKGDLLESQYFRKFILNLEWKPDTWTLIRVALSVEVQA